MCDVFLIENNRNLRDTLTEGLAMHGYAVCSKPNGLESIISLIKSCPSLIVYDVEKNEEYDRFKKMLFANKHYQSVPVLLTSSHEIKNWSGTGALDFLEKPYSLKKLLNLVEMGLSKTVNRAISKSPS